MMDLLNLHRTAVNAGEWLKRHGEPHYAPMAAEAVAFCAVAAAAPTKAGADEAEGWARSRVDELMERVMRHPVAFDVKVPRK